MYQFRLISFVTLVAVVLIVVVKGQSPSLECYSCLSQGTDTTCVDDPELAEGQKIVQCESGWCTIVRKEYTEMPGKIVTFLRSCELTEPAISDGVISDTHYTTHYRSCRTTKCNTGDGLTDLEGVGDGGPGNSTLIVVPEESSSSAQVVINFSIVFMTSALAIWHSVA